MANIEITIEQLNESYDWAEVFGEGSGGNTDKTLDTVPPRASVSVMDLSRADVVEIVAAVNGENDEQDWIGVFRLKDGRYLIAQGSCDYTGWDCQARNQLTVARSLKDAIRYGLSETEQVRLGLEL